ncbi:MAG: MFS transporter [Steroidobacteraceae bacterium]|nr:MFS transporter [Steroidobacteraceae bacterium]
MADIQADSGAIAAPATVVRGACSPLYRNYVLATLFLTYVVNVMDRGVLALLLESIRKEFTLTDAQLGLLSGLPFALFYSTLGIPIAALADRSVRKNVLAGCCALWSGATAAAGLAINFGTLFLARVMTAVGEAGGTPPSHSLISDYFPDSRRATALSIYALGVPVGTMLGSLLGGWGNELFGWRMTFVLIGVPGIIVALLVWFTVREPPRGMSDLEPRKAVVTPPAPPLFEVLAFLWKYPSFRHMCLAAGLHSVVWYAGSQLNAVFFQRSHDMTSAEAGSWLALFAGVGTLGTLLGGLLSDRMSARFNDRRWYMWVPGIATVLMVPFQFGSYLADDLRVVVPSFVVMVVLASMFFGPSFAVSQSLATLRTRAVATSILLFVQTFVGLGLGPYVAGMLSDLLRPSMGLDDSMRWGLTIVGLVNLWAAAHYFWGARTIRENLATTEALNRAQTP